MRNEISKTEVSNFKNLYCNENSLIIELLKSKLTDYLIPPILDVGAGLGDIAFNAFPNKKTICIDLNAFELDKYPLSTLHERLQVDFFKYISSVQIKTIFISHTMQFLDTDIGILNKKIKELSPIYLVIITNDNDDFMGDLIYWAEHNTTTCNPEVNPENFPSGYEKIDQVKFSASLISQTFEDLAEQIEYLMLIEPNKYRSNLIAYLQVKLNNTPEFSIKQTINIYRKNGR